MWLKVQHGEAEKAEVLPEPRAQAEVVALPRLYGRRVPSRRCHIFLLEKTAVVASIEGFRSRLGALEGAHR